MNMDLSIVIPSRNEEFLVKTVEDLLKNIRGNTEIIVILDGWETELPKDDRIKVIHNQEAVGQRAGTNQGVRLSEAKYIMKVDAHCAFDEGFDVKMMADMQDNWTMVPTMRNLHAFNWKCEDGHTRYQSPSGPCQQCGKETVKDVVWIPKRNPQSVSYCFDEEPHFQYYNEYKKRPEYVEMEKTKLTESMSIQGSCFMVTRDKYWELNICDENLGSWGSQGIEVACKTWLSGGRVVINQKTWYAHMFRTQGGDFGFPYVQPGRAVQKAKQTVRELFFDNKWKGQIYPLSWLLEKFWPVTGWSQEMFDKIKKWPLPIPNMEEEKKEVTKIEIEKKPTIGVLYYTDNQLDLEIMTMVQEQIKRGIGDFKLVSVSLKPIYFGQNIVMPLERGILTMHKQILAGLEALDTDIVFFCEHDVMYHPSHFDFVPTRKDIYYYNKNLWRVHWSDGYAVRYDHKSLSQMCAYREPLIAEYKNRVERIERDGWKGNGFEPGTRSIRRRGFSDSGSEFYESKVTNMDIRHDNNLSRSKWNPSQFLSNRSCRNWKETTVDKIEGWENLSKIINNNFMEKEKKLKKDGDDNQEEPRPEPIPVPTPEPIE